MWFLYLDESGDLGFDFVNKKPTKFFSVTILAISSYQADRKMAKIVKKVLSRKLNPRKKRKRIVEELKGTATTLEIKKYFYNLIKTVQFGLYSITIDKRQIYESLISDKERIYNYIARLVLDKIPFEKNHGDTINLVIDKCKNKPEIKEFNRYIRSQLESRINPKTPLYISHLNSKESVGLQACDLFCWGIFQIYERRNREWYEVFSKKIKFEELYFGK